MYRFGCYVAFAACLSAQVRGVSPDLRFDVASFKPSEAQGPAGGIRPAPGGQRYQATNCPIRLMIQVAYRVKAEQIAGAPAWFDTERYDMEAKAEKQSTTEELHVMLMNLLVDRLHLKFHREKKEMAVYALTVDKGGPKLTAHEASNAGEPWIDVGQAIPLHITMKATFSPMDYFAFRLSQLMDRPVVDLTGLKGGYDFTLSYTRELPLGFPEGGRINGEAPDTSGPSVYDALRTQLGLQLKAQKSPVDVIVIDHAEKPSAN